jgi:UDP-2,3-diacylglucosamine hydrolase
MLENNSRYINLGDWIRYNTYAVMENGQMELRSYTGEDHRIIRKS